MKLQLLASVLLLGATAQGAFSPTRQEPAPDAKGVCADTLLRLTFAEPPTLGSSGQLKVLRATDGKVADTLQLADPHPTNLYGTKVLRYEPFRVEGNTATIQLHAHVLEPQTTYSVVVAPGTFASAQGEAFAGITNGAWQFTTRAPLPKGRTRVEVAPDSRGDFCTLQGAVDYVPEDNYTPFDIYVRNGTYDAVAYLGPGRNRLHLLGEDRKQTILAGRNNDKLNSGRMMRPFLSVDADDVLIENLTVRNTTPYRGSQAEVLRVPDVNWSLLPALKETLLRTT